MYALAFYIIVIAIVITFVATYKTSNPDVMIWPGNENTRWINFQYVNPGYNYTWQPYPGATSYTVELLNTAGELVGDLRREEASAPLGPRTTVGSDVLNIISDGSEYSIRVTANTPNGKVSNQLNAPCFLAGSIVQMEDGEKCIEDVRIGDKVRGAFGEINTVLALHRPLLGNHKLIKINSHISTSHHPHVGADGKFYCGEPKVVDNSTYGRFHEVITQNGKEQMFLHGLKPGRVQELLVGIALKTVDGSRMVETIDAVDMPPTTQLYNLVVSQSHTYHVDGYAVTGWPREDDFDYDTWSVHE